MGEFNTAEYLDPVRTQTWANGRHLVRCVKVIQETHDVVTFTFGMGQPILFFFKPGQFVTLELEIDGERVMRSYTISSSPSIPYSFSITVKRVEGGRVSNWLHDNLRPGDQIAVHGPVGNFNVLDYPADKVLMLSGGVGVTPVMSMARWLFDTDSDTDVQFIHCARTPKDIIYRYELDYMSSRIENFHLHTVCEKTEVSQSWDGYRGRLSLPMLELMAPDYKEREVFCCGPEPFMTAVKNMLILAGFDMEHYHEESFDSTPKKDVERAKANADEAALEAEEQVLEMATVRFAESGQSVSVALGTNLNEAAAEAGLSIPKACGIGICGACKVKVTGDTNMVHNGGISRREEDEGYVLSCCTEVAGDLEVEY